jgi:hypothetical protein
MTASEFRRALLREILACLDHKADHAATVLVRLYIEACRYDDRWLRSEHGLWTRQI